MNKHAAPLLFCFDLDGTLLPRTSTCQCIADQLGHSVALRELERRYASGEISNREVAEATATYYRGHSLGEIETCLHTAPWIQGVSETIGILKSKDIPSLLSTVTWQFASRIVARRFGFKEFSGTEMEVDEAGLLTGNVSRHFDEFDKREFVARYCAINKIDAQNVVAVGDSRSDIPLFAWAGFSIALNATPDARAAASVALDTEDLRDIFRVIARS